MITIILILSIYVLTSGTDTAIKQDQLFEELKEHMIKEEIQLDSINKRIDSIAWEVNLHK